MAQAIKTTLEVRMVCAKCGTELETMDCGHEYDTATDKVLVTPCDVCLTAVKEKAYEDGAASVEKEA